MKARNAAGRILSVLGTTTLVALSTAGCGNRNGDINTVQPGYVKKSYFLTDSEWYYRRSIPRAETSNAFAIEGQGDIFIDRVKFKIEEDHLIAYRPHEAIPGSQDEEARIAAGNKEFEGSIIAAWPITAQFDIIRGYDPQTGNETNSLEENHSDRPWYEREYIRVNFSKNELNGSFSAGWSAYEFPLTFVSTETQWKDGATYPTDPQISRFSEDYIEINEKVFLGMDIYSCAYFGGFSWDVFGNCGFGEATLRHSFVKVPATATDYIPRDYPDSVVQKDPQSGKPIYDEETGEVVREPIFDRFGIYRTETPTYDRGYGNTESGKLFRAFVFNIWKNHKDAQGNTLNYSCREPKPIIYYLNAEYPQRWRKAAAEVAADYNRVFKSMVTDLQNEHRTKQGGCATSPAVPDMYEIRDNDCNANNIRAFVSTNPDLLFAVKRAVCANGEECEDPLSKVGIGNLEKVCTSLETATTDPVTGKPGFEWQRIGDLRFKMVVWLSNPQQSGWGGYGPMHADVRTGESIAATAYLRGFEYESGASYVTDYIELINDEKTTEEIIYGQDIRKHVADTLRQKGAIKASTAGRPFIDCINHRMEELGGTKERLLQEVDPNQQNAWMKRIEGTRVESDYLTNELQLIFASKGKWHPGDPITEELRKAAGPLARQENQDAMSDTRERSRRALRNAGFCYLDAEFDPHWAGLAFELKGLPREKRYEAIAHRLIKHVMAHELGHNFGFAHNFEGSFDALNYYPGFWEDHYKDDEAKLLGKYEEKRNSSVMEYMSSKGMFSDRLGKYDEAAIRFAYGSQVAVFNKAQLGDQESAQTWKYLRAFRYANDYTKLPDHLCGGTCASPEAAVEVVTDRKWVTWDYMNQPPPANEVPFEFCDNTYDRRTPWCATFDYGSNLREIHANYYSWWRDYFFFNNFIRDRLVPISWDPFYSTVPLSIAMYNITLVGQYLYYFRALDRNFLETGLGQDMLVTLAHGLNMASEVMSSPEPIRMCPWPGVTAPAVYIPYYYFPGSDCDQYADINTPYAQQIEAIQMPLGVGRPTTIGFTDDFVDYDLAFIGSYFDKADTMWYLGRFRPQFFKYNFDLDRRNYQISLFRLFEGEIRSFYDSLIKLDPYLIDPETATELGSFWCRDPDNMTVASLGHFTPRQMLDPTTGAAPAGPPADCANPAVVYPALLRNMPFDAMWYAYALFSSPVDSELDMGKSLKVYVVGSDDEFPDWRNLPAGQTCSCVDALTGLDYRAIHQPTGIPDLGCRLVERACDAQADYFTDETNDYQKERWRSWFERLELARDLSRIFDR